MIIEFPKAKTGYSRAARRIAASQPRRSKNGTPEERAAKKTAATVIDVTSRLESRAAFKRAAKAAPMTVGEAVDFYIAATPQQQAMISAIIIKARARRNLKLTEKDQ